MGKSAPKAPDPAQTAAAQGSWNSFTAQQSQAMNMVGQNSPWGSLSYDQTGSTTMVDPSGKNITVPQYTANTTLSPTQQGIFDKTQSAEQNLAGIANDQSAWLASYLKGGVDTSGVPGLQGSIGGNYSTSLDGIQTSYAGADDFSADRQRTEDAILQRLAPQQAQDENKLRTTLINQGIRPGSPAWDSEYARLSSANNDARLGAILAGGQEQSRLVGLARDAAGFNNDAITGKFTAQNGASLTAANFNNAARGQGIAEATQARNQPVNELLAILSGTQVQNPGSTFAQTPQTGVAGVDYTGLVNNKYQADMQAYQSKMGGLFGLGASLIKAVPWSDRRLKEDIKRVGTLDNGLSVYSYRLKGQNHYQIGVMAQEVAEKRPEAIVNDPSGFMRVNYERAVA